MTTVPRPHSQTGPAALPGADLDTLATALHVRIDARLKTEPRWASWRAAVGITPELNDGEALALLGYVSEARWLRFARRQMPVRTPMICVFVARIVGWIHVPPSRGARRLGRVRRSRPAPRRTGQRLAGGPDRAQAGGRAAGGALDGGSVRRPDRRPASRLSRPAAGPFGGRGLDRRGLAPRGPGGWGRRGRRVGGLEAVARASQPVTDLVLARLALGWIR